MYSYDEAMKASLEYFGGNELAAKVWVEKYALRDTEDNLLECNPDQMHHRIAKEFARVEKSKFKEPFSEEFIYECLKDFGKIIPQGSPMYGIGNSYKYISLSNCFVIPTYDSYGGICKTDEEIAQIAKRRGGVGYDISPLRPKDMPVTNSARTTTGSVSFMHRFSHTGREVGQNSRRAAQMITISVHHPDVMDFIKIKDDRTSVTGANISVRVTDEFLNAVKQGEKYLQKWPVDSDSPQVQRWVDARSVWKEIIYRAWRSSEPGCLYWSRIIQGSPADCYGEEGFTTTSTNPCLTGDTLVYVADGRGNVPIFELAKSGEDVPVFCLADNDTVQIRYMRRPRKTGESVPVYRVNLDDGSSIKVTANHKFLTKNNKYVETKDLRRGDSLRVVTKFEASLKDIFPKSNNSSQNYYWINYGRVSHKSEHRLITEFHQNAKIQYGCVVHHKDFNALNNSPSNLEIMTKEAHDKLHGELMRGDNNPMRRAAIEWSEEKWADYRAKQSKNNTGEGNARFSGFSNDELKEHALRLTKGLGYRFSIEEWQKYAKQFGLPQQFSKWRNDHLGGVVGLAKWAANELGLEHFNCDPRVLRNYQKLLSQGYNCVIENRQLFIIKNCEVCGTEFKTEDRWREIGLCSQECRSELIRQFNANMDVATREKINNKLRSRAAIRKEATKEKQIHIYLELKQELRRDPTKREWEGACRQNNCPWRVGKRSPFKKYSELKEAASNYNHKVVSVEFAGYEDVYNGTVDEFHNFFVGGFESTTKDGKRKWQYLCNRQCGEIPLCPYDSCRLLLLNLIRFVDNPFTSEAKFNYDEFYKYVIIAQRLMDDIVDLEIECVDRILGKIENDLEPPEVKATELNLWRKVKEKAVLGRRTGLGITSLGDALAALGIKYGSQASIDESEKIYKTLKLASYRSSVEMARELGPFPIWDWNKEKDNLFLLNIKEEDPQLYADMKKYGRHSIANLTTAPCGSASLVASVCQERRIFGTSSGIEPVFMLSYKRRRKININTEKTTRVDFKDELGDCWQEFDVYHPAVQMWMDITGETDIQKSPWWGACAEDLHWPSRVKLQAAATRHIDHSISSTLNLPEDVTVEQVAEIYESAWESGCKGITIYRKGCRDGVLVDKQEKKRDGVARHDAPKRPDFLPADIHVTQYKGTPYFVIVGLLQGEPYEVFAGENMEQGQVLIDRKFKKGKIVKTRRGQYVLEVPEGGIPIVSNIAQYLTDDEEAVTRLVSSGLRHGIPIEFLVHQLEKVRGGMHSFAKIMGRVLKKYIKDGTKISGEACSCGGELVRSEGCATCVSCGTSKCG